MAQLRATVLVNVTPEGPDDPVADYVDDLALRVQGAAEEVGAFVEVKVEVVSDVETVVTPTVATPPADEPLPPVRSLATTMTAKRTTPQAETVFDLNAWLAADHDPGTDADEVDDHDPDFEDGFDDVTAHAHESDVTVQIHPDPFDLIRKRLP